MHTGFYLLLEVILVINLLQYCHNTLNQGEAILASVFLNSAQCNLLQENV